MYLKFVPFPVPVLRYYFYSLNVYLTYTFLIIVVLSSQNVTRIGVREGKQEYTRDCYYALVPVVNRMVIGVCLTETLRRGLIRKK